MSSTSPSASLSTQCGDSDSTNSLANVVLSTVIVTVLVLVSSALLAHYFWRKWRQQKEKHLMLEIDLEKGVKDQFAFDNPCFKESLTLTPVNIQQEQQPTQTNGGHNSVGNDPSSVTLTTAKNTMTTMTTTPITTSNSASRLQHSKSVSKWTQWSPFNFNNECDKKRAFNDSFLDNRGTQTVSLRSDDFTGLGFNICGNIRDGIFIKDLLHHGPASKSGKIRVGDRIKKVNINFENMVFEDALTILSYASPYAVDIEIESLSGRQHNLEKDRNMTQSQEPAHPKFKSSSISDLTKIQQITPPNTKTQQKSSTLKLISAANASISPKTNDITDSNPKRKKSDDFNLLQKSEQKLKKIGAVLVFPKLKEQFRFNCGTSNTLSKNEPATQPSVSIAIEREENQNNENYEIESTTIDEPKFPKRMKSRAPQPPISQLSQSMTVQDEPTPPKCRRTASLSDLSKVVDLSMLKSSSATISSTLLRPMISTEKSKSICDFFEKPNFLSIQFANFNNGFSVSGQNNCSPDTIGALRKATIWGNLEDAVLSSLNDTNNHSIHLNESQSFSLCDKLDRRISKSPILPKHLAVLEQVSLTNSEDDDQLSSSTADNQSALSVETLVDEPQAIKSINGDDYEESREFKTFGNLENPKSNVLKNVNKIKRLLSSASSLSGFQTTNESGSLTANQS